MIVNLYHALEAQPGITNVPLEQLLSGSEYYSALSELKTVGRYWVTADLMLMRA